MAVRKILRIGDNRLREIWVFCRQMNITDIEVAALVLSIKAALFSLLCILPIGVGVGWLLAKAFFRGKSLLHYLLHAFASRHYLQLLQVLQCFLFLHRLALTNFQY